MAVSEAGAIGFLIVGIVLLILFVIAISFVLRESMLFEKSAARKRVSLVANESKSLLTLREKEYLKTLVLMPSNSGTVIFTFITDDDASEIRVEVEAGVPFWIERSESFPMKRTEVRVQSFTNMDLKIDMRITISRI